MQSQRRARIPKRMPCAIQVGQHRFPGLVLNVSQGGLFIQTNADPGRGSEVALELQPPGESYGIALSGTVAWRKLVPSRLRKVAGGGFGLRIDQADERYYRALARWMQPDDGGPAEVVRGANGGVEDVSVTRVLAQDAPLQPAWRVRVRAAESPRSRSLTVEAPDAEQARAIAMRHIGRDWEVLEVEPL
ncbi:MAG: PilZ domain-containing protein [Myxococcota bacterium]